MGARSGCWWIGLRVTLLKAQGVVWMFSVSRWGVARANPGCDLAIWWAIRPCFVVVAGGRVALELHMLPASPMVLVSHLFVGIVAVVQESLNACVPGKRPKTIMMSAT